MSETLDPGERAKHQAADTAQSGLEAGEHEPAPPSKDPVTDENRDAIQDAFDDLEALHADLPVDAEAAGDDE